MSNYDITIETVVKQTITIWAIPRSKWFLEEHPEECPYTFQVRTDKPWDEGAVQVYEQEIELTVPAGINVTAQAITTFKEAQREIQLQADEKINTLEERIKALLQITHQPDLQAVE